MSATVGGLLCAAGQRLRAAAFETPRLEARLLLAHALGCDTDALLRDPRAPVPETVATRFSALLARRLAHEPVAHLLGHWEFWSLPIAVSPAALIPRADSETLIEAALAARPDRAAVRRVLDLGTGTGCLLLAALTEYRDAFGIGLDRSAAAARLAQGNAERLGLRLRAGFVVGDWAAALRGPFDLVLCNPPYIESDAVPGLMPEVARHEPRLALDGGADGADAYRAVLHALPALLAADGVAVLELGAGQRGQVGEIAAAAGLVVQAVRADLSGTARAMVLRAGRG